MDFGFAHEPSQVVCVDFSVAFRVVNGPKSTRLAFFRYVSNTGTLECTGSSRQAVRRCEQLGSRIARLERHWIEAALSGGVITVGRCCGSLVLPAYTGFLSLFSISLNPRELCHFRLHLRTDSRRCLLTPNHRGPMAASPGRWMVCATSRIRNESWPHSQAMRRLTNRWC